MDGELINIERGWGISDGSNTENELVSGGDELGNIGLEVVVLSLLEGSDGRVGSDGGEVSGGLVVDIELPAGSSIECKVSLQSKSTKSLIDLASNWGVEGNGGGELVGEVVVGGSSVEEKSGGALDSINCEVVGSLEGLELSISISR